jgi:hypothetical protein
MLTEDGSLGPGTRIGSGKLVEILTEVNGIGNGKMQLGPRRTLELQSLDKVERSAWQNSCRAPSCDGLKSD